MSLVFAVLSKLPDSAKTAKLKRMLSEQTVQLILKGEKLYQFLAALYSAVLPTGVRKLAQPVEVRQLLRTNTT